MKKIVQFIDKRMTIIKLLFVFSVLIFVVRQLAKIIHQVNGDQFKTVLASQSKSALVIMLVLGFISITPMLIYDYSIVKFLPGKFAPGYVIRSGWVVNTFTNLLGFGGLLGASLRAHFYGHGATKKQILYAISKVALFLIAGLSLLCFVSLIMIFGFGIGSTFAHYWIWLLGGAIYFPAMIIFTKINNSSFFSDLSTKQEIIMTTGSFLEWSSAMGFFILIGYLMGLPINFAVVIPIFVVANVAGVVSMIPGGLGSFDIFIIIGLGFIGVARSDALVWILLYRLFYYLLPFLVGTALFIHDTGSKINAFLDELPRILIQRIAQIFLTVFMYFSGIMMLLFATVPNVVIVNRLYIRLIPYSIIFVSHLANIVVAFLLIGLASGLWGRTKRAFWPTVVVLIISILDTWFNEAFTWRMITLFAVILVMLWLSRGVLYRDRMANSWGVLLFNGSIFVVTFVIYTLIGIATNRHTPLHFDEAYLFPSEAAWLVGFIGLIIAMLVLLLMNRYLTAKQPKWLSEPFNADRVKAVIDKFGGNEDSHLAFLRDKRLYFYQEDGEDQVFFMYRQIADKLLIMGDPVGNSEKFATAIDQFMTVADKQGLKLVFYEINQDLTMQLHENGFDFIKTGEDGLVNLAEFTLSGKRHRGERALMNKFNREGYQFEILQPPFDDQLLTKLQNISDEWLDNKAEKGFSLGFFDNYYLNQAPIAVMKNADGEIVAFANLMPDGNHMTTSIDLMRSSAKAPSGIMDGILINLYDHSRQQGYTYFDLGMSPLSNVGTSRFSFTQERIVHLIYQYGYKIYRFEGLRSYKNKYVDRWEPKYIAYYRGSSLVFTVLQILMIVNRPRNIPQSGFPKLMWGILDWREE
ncbi:bifunctional lysylphosphatidylglycerol flippase/synthetase MprF [Lentilactobacillus diolivorans]|nr:bifunctional lysylphosphatidylglycerol flippase/synthetase MprF [Lentilactobacillus diolivorans]MDH5104927.1 bifunctional lysylphosphatidylglycerol flippase/synthetase MprF [Lentilactobacillus diolivorans]